MKPLDSHDDLAVQSVPEMIQKLWALYMDMSLDPTLAASACHVRSAALALEDMRRMALEVYMEGREHPPVKPAKKPKRATRNTRSTRNTDKDQAAKEWLMAARAASPWKN